VINLSKFLPFFIPNVHRACSFFTNLDLFCIDNARVIYRKIRYLLMEKILGLYMSMEILIHFVASCQFTRQ